MTDTSTTDTTSPPETDAWTFPVPLADIVAKHRSRIDNENFVSSILETWHDGETEPSWVVIITGGNESVSPRDAALHAAGVMASCTGCDYLLFSFDTHMSQHQNNPTTGKPWEPGEMQRMCDEEGYCDTGNIRDNLVVAIVRRSDQKLLFHSIPYHFHKGELMLFEDEHMINEWAGDDKGGMSGLVPDRLRNAMAQPTVLESLKALGKTPEDLGFSSDDARLVRLHQIMAGTRVLSDAAFAADIPNLYLHLIPAETDEERQILSDSSGRMRAVRLSDLGEGDDDDTTG